MKVHEVLDANKGKPNMLIEPFDDALLHNINEKVTVKITYVRLTRPIDTRIVVG